MTMARLWAAAIKRTQMATPPSAMAFNPDADQGWILHCGYIYLHLGRLNGTPGIIYYIERLTSKWSCGLAAVTGVTLTAGT
jgi:hypothetical protein